MPSYRDLSGSKFGKLLVVKRVGTYLTKTLKSAGATYKCICDCGKGIVVYSGNLSSNSTCGCSRFSNLTGQRFGKLVAIRRLESISKDNRHFTYWECKCDCGNVAKVPLGSLKSGFSKSCGCMRQNHGLSGLKEYKIWNAIKQRCYNVGNKEYVHYGGRGIKMCERWVTSFENFYEDMGSRPGNSSIDRINVNLDYTPENCRWSSYSIQNKNRQVNQIYRWNGEELTVGQWIAKIIHEGEFIGFRDKAII